LEKSYFEAIEEARNNYVTLQQDAEDVEKTIILAIEFNFLTTFRSKPGKNPLNEVENLRMALNEVSKEYDRLVEFLIPFFSKADMLDLLQIFILRYKAICSWGKIPKILGTLGSGETERNRIKTFLEKIPENLYLEN